MKDYRRLEEIGNVDEAFIKEVFDYTEKAERERRHLMSKTFILKTAAIAACAAVVIGAGAAAMSRRELPVKQEDAAPMQTTEQTELSAPVAEPHSEAATEPAPAIVPVTTSTDKPVSEPVSETEPVSEPTPVSEPIESDSRLSENQDDCIVEVEHSYNEKIANGEEVNIATYIGIPYRISSDEYAVVGDFTYTLQNVLISDRLPEGITKSDLTASVGEVCEYPNGVEKRINAKGDEVRSLTIGECIDDEGVYSGPGDGYKWVFLKLDITNNSGEETVKFINSVRLAGGELKTTMGIVDGKEADMGFREYEYFEEACYHSEVYFDYDNGYEMAFAGLSDEERAEIESRAAEKYGSVEEYLRDKFYFMAHFDGGETKTLTIGFPVSNYYVYGDLFLELNPTGADSSDLINYIPLK